jgi:unsaturated chondroitin disaccharide hydrolase
MKIMLGGLSLVGFVVAFTIPSAQGQATTGCTDQALALAEGQLTDTIAYTSTSQFPVETNPANANRWSLADSSHWTSGFFPGWVWLMYEKDLSNAWFTRAQAQTAAMQNQQSNASDHDIGLKILSSFGNGYRITRDPAYLSTIQTAAQAMTTLYRPTAGVIESWPNFDSHITVIIDNMMNLELLFFAAQNGGDPSLYNMALSHALKTMQNHVRADGSTYHVVDYNPDGTVFSKFTWQGAGNETTWARGQAWAIYGFTMTYRYTKDARFLATAQQLADYFLNNLPPDFVPYWDFSKCCTAPRDSSAAAIAAAGLLELSTFMTTQADKDRYHNAALNIQASLSSPAYLGDRLATDGILLHGTVNVPGGDADKSLIYGDYYFIQGCYRAKTPPPAPTNLAATAASSSQINLSWDSQTGPIRYTVKRSTAPGGPYETIAPPPVLTTNDYANTGLAPGTTYYYIVAAINPGGEGPNSSEVSATTPNVPVPLVTSLAPSSGTPGGAGFTLIVNGGHFNSSSVVRWNGANRTTTFVNGAQIKAAILASDIATAGTRQVAVFNGSSSEISNAVAFAVRKAATTTSLVSSANPAAFGRAVTFTATVRPASSGFPTGTVTFLDGTMSLGTATLRSGKATLVRSNLAVRSHLIKAVYGGDANYTGSSSGTLTEVIRKAARFSSVTSSTNSTRRGPNLSANHPAGV